MGLFALLTEGGLIRVMARRKKEKNLSDDSEEEPVETKRKKG
jgi:hypothetical protein